MFRLTINTNNDAFGCSQADLAYGIARVLHDYATELEATGLVGVEDVLRDLNGNTVGEASCYFLDDADDEYDDMVAS